MSGSHTASTTFRNSNRTHSGSERWEPVTRSPPATSVASSIHPQAVGWWVLAALSGLVGLVVVAQALARQSLVESETHGVLRALGVERRQMILVGLARTFTIGIIGMLGGMALSYLLSPLTPVGEARLVEPSRGFVFDPLVVSVGLLAGMVLVLGIGLLSDLRTLRLSRREGRVWPGRPAWSSRSPGPELIPVR